MCVSGAKSEQLLSAKRTISLIHQSCHSIVAHARASEKIGQIETRHQVQFDVHLGSLHEANLPGAPTERVHERRVAHPLVYQLAVGARALQD